MRRLIVVKRGDRQQNQCNQYARSMGDLIVRASSLCTMRAGPDLPWGELASSLSSRFLIFMSCLLELALPQSQVASGFLQRGPGLAAGRVNAPLPRDRSRRGLRLAEPRAQRIGYPLRRDAALM